MASCCEVSELVEIVFVLLPDGVSQHTVLIGLPEGVDQVIIVLAHGQQPADLYVPPFHGAVLDEGVDFVTDILEECELDHGMLLFAPGGQACHDADRPGQQFELFGYIETEGGVGDFERDEHDQEQYPHDEQSLFHDVLR
jgi:hypothetical protein